MNLHDLIIPVAEGLFWYTLHNTCPECDRGLDASHHGCVRTILREQGHWPAHANVFYCECRVCRLNGPDRHYFMTIYGDVICPHCEKGNHPIPPQG